MYFVTWPAVSIIPWIKTTIIQSCLLFTCCSEENIEAVLLRNLKRANLYRLIRQNHKGSIRSLWFRYHFGFWMWKIELSQCWQLVEQHVQIKCSSNERTKLSSNEFKFNTLLFCRNTFFTLIMLRKWYRTNLSQRNEGIKA